MVLGMGRKGFGGFGEGWVVRMGLDGGVYFGGGFFWGLEGKSGGVGFFWYIVLTFRFLKGEVSIEKQFYDWIF